MVKLLHRMQMVKLNSHQSCAIEIQNQINHFNLNAIIRSIHEFLEMH